MKTIISILFFIFALLYIFYSVNFEILFDNISLFSLNAIIYLIIFNILSIFLMAYRFLVLFNKISIYDSFRINSVSMGLNQITPARGGDIIKPFMLKNITNFKLSYLFAILLIERFLDVLVLVLLAFFLLPIIKDYIFLFILLIFSLILIFRNKNTIKIVKLIKFIKNKKVKNFILKFYITLIKFDIKKIIIAFFISIFMYAIYLMTMHFFINNFATFDLKFIDTAIVFVITTLGLMVPSAPGSIGTYEASMVFALGLFNISKEEALSFALVYHFIQILTLIILTITFSIRKKVE